MGGRGSGAWKKVGCWLGRTPPLSGGGVGSASKKGPDAGTKSVSVGAGGGGDDLSGWGQVGAGVGEDLAPAEGVAAPEGDADHFMEVVQPLVQRPQLPLPGAAAAVPLRGGGHSR